MISAVTLSPAPHMAPRCIPAVSVSICSRLMSVVSGWAPVSTMLSKAAAVLRPGMVLLTVLVPAMLSRPDSAFIHSFLHSRSRLFIRSLAGWLVHLFIHSFVQSFIYSFIHSLILSFVPVSTLSFFHSFIHSLTHSLLCATDVSPWSQVRTVLEWLPV